jgi:tyrosine aminotransferase
VEAGANRLAQVILGANHLAQSAIPTCLDPATPGLAKWKYTLRNTLERQATFLCNKLATTPSCQKCLQVIPPQGAMYAIIKIHVDALDETIQNDVDFTRQLLEEENVFVLPGSAFGAKNVFRVVFCSPETTLAIAANRIAAFCHRHAIV